MDANARKYMNNSEELVDSFFNLCDDALTSKYILAEVKISRLLQCIASSTILFDTMQHLCEGFDYNVEWNKAINTFNREKRFRLPEESSKQASFALCVLLEVDTGRIALAEFLRYYFPSNYGPNFEYRAFAETFISPLKKAVFYTLKGTRQIETDNGNTTIFPAKVSAESAIKSINSVMQLVANSSNYDTKDDFLLTCETIKSGLISHNHDIVAGARDKFILQIAQNKAFIVVKDELDTVKEYLKVFLNE